MPALLLTDVQADEVSIAFMAAGFVHVVAKSSNMPHCSITRITYSAYQPLYAVDQHLWAAQLVSQAYWARNVIYFKAAGTTSRIDCIAGSLSAGRALAHVRWIGRHSEP